jgi:hypothetical protein
MALLQSEINATIGNVSFSQKRPVLAKSEYTLTKEIAQAAAWGSGEVGKRQKKLAKLAVTTWSGKFS